MSFFSITFATPLVLAALALLPVIWWLNRLTPPKPTSEPFPPFAILLKILKKDDTPAKSPWWLTLLRVILSALIIFALAEPIYDPNQRKQLAEGPLVIVIDDSWSTAPDWQQRVDAASTLISEAESNNSAVLVVKSSLDNAELSLTSASDARRILASIEPLPTHSYRDEVSGRIEAALGSENIGTLALILSPSADENASSKISELLEIEANDVQIYQTSGQELLAVNSVENLSASLKVNIVGLNVVSASNFELTGYDLQSRPLASTSFQFKDSQQQTEVELEAPFELLNEIVRVSIEGENTAAASFLLDDSFKRRRVALFDGNTNNIVNPLLTANHFVARALSPFVDLIDTESLSLNSDLENLLLNKPSAIILADIGSLEASSTEQLTKWVEDGGLLVRFAGPKTAASGDQSLLPVRIRAGERQLGGALSWSEPQPLAAFPLNSPYSGIEISEEIQIKRQVLAEPSLELADRTWASLTDGTPLVTSQTLGNGRIVFFHTSAETSWSNLPLSGQFSEMLRRTINLARSASGSTTNNQQASFLPPYRLLSAYGRLENPDGDTAPIEISENGDIVAEDNQRPGFYGTKDGWQAINLFNQNDELKATEIADGNSDITLIELAESKVVAFKAWLLFAAFCLLVIDALAILWMSGAFSKQRLTYVFSSSRNIALLVVAATLSISSADNVNAQDTQLGDVKIIEQIESTKIAYVVTGDQQTDRVSRLGLEGLGFYLRTRTALEPSAPAGVNVETDELSFYPLIYWPITDNAEPLSNEALANVENFMQQGGTILFDTRDQGSNFGNSASVSNRTLILREILADLDIPPLEPVPEDHVLTKAFYLLEQFPGRFSGSPLWVEALAPDRENGDRPVHSGDGVTPIMITSNDFAGAWAMNADRQFILPIVPPNERQRTMAYRTGINIMMYMLTGNYKADQVHIPTLLERLGQ